MNSPLSLLLIDDDADDRDFFLEAVREIDPAISCTTTIDGPSGLSYLENENNPLPQYIFLDLRLPGMNSRTVLQRIKDNPRTTGIPVMIYTTSKEVAEAEEMVSLGAAHFTTKPANPGEIYYVLSLVLEGKW